MSTFIFVKGAANRGKSNAICALARLLKVPPSGWRKNGKEVEAILDKYGKTIGLYSEGDPECGSVDRIIDAISNKGCDIVVAACRTGGKTQTPIIDFLNKPSDKIIEIYTLRKPNAQYSPTEIELFSEAAAMTLLHLIANL